MKYNFKTREEYNKIITWIRKYWVENANDDTKAIIGISGGKDSTVAAALCVAALGEDKVVGILMPQGEQADIQDAIDVCELLGITYVIHNIDETCKSIYHEMIDASACTNKMVEINTPPRIRMTVLYAYAAALGGRVVNTCNYSEDYVGYSTKYGDLAGDFGLLRYYTATEVVKLGVEWLTQYMEDWDAVMVKRFVDLLKKTPSDGLCGTTDEDNLGFTYETLDNYLRTGISPKYETLKKIETLHKRNFHKRCIDIPSPYYR